MRLGVLTTSWPSEARPWAGHFVRDQAEALAGLGVEVVVVTPAWSAHGALETSPSFELIAPRLLGGPGSLARAPVNGLRALASLARVASRVEADRWLCHWWPTCFAAPSGVEAMAVLHGSDVDLLARLPGWIRGWIGRRLPTVAAAESVAGRFAVAAGVPAPPVKPLGAHRARAVDPVPPMARAWADSGRPRALTVAREADGKGWSAMREAEQLVPEIDWLGVTPEHGVGPSGIRTLISRADVVVVPSEAGPTVPSEGLPHIIVQAVVAGVPVVGGPNRAVQAALRSMGQEVVPGPGGGALACSVRAAVERRRHAVLADRAREAGQDLQWSAVATQWLDAVMAGCKPPGHRTTIATPSC